MSGTEGEQDSSYGCEEGSESKEQLYWEIVFEILLLAARSEDCEEEDEGGYREAESYDPPGTVVDAANATVAISAAMTEHDSEVLMSHVVPIVDNAFIGSKIAAALEYMWLPGRICREMCHPHSHNSQALEIFQLSHRPILWKEGDGGEKWSHVQVVSLPDEFISFAQFLNLGENTSADFNVSKLSREMKRGVSCVILQF
nr:hypothetical protein F383_29031 [Ipomoea batatas]